jgi:bifunctional non-homologous end joining protein LigD
MALTLYRKKRSFKETPEPTGGKAAGPALRFVIQKHDASRLHYDFRLEMEGVLKSWAVPKGPSTDPTVKRLAMMVEDHPYDYRSFEGIIPKGQYGGGTVIVWDEGTYEAVGMDGKSKKEQEKELLKQLHKGKLTFILHGEKLSGEWALVRSGYQGENAWLLIKVKDEFARKSDITKKDKSVKSGKTIQQVEKTSENVWNSNREETKKKMSSKKSTTKKPARKKAAKTVKKNTTDNKALLKNATKAAFPSKLHPMLATLVDKPFDEEGWLYEVKWDGYRALAYINKGKVELQSRNDKTFNEKFYPIHAALENIGVNAVLDGEIIVAKDNGISSFSDLQNWRSEADGQLQYYVFDILWLDGYSLMELPLTERRQVLEATLPVTDTILLSQAFDSNGKEFFAAAEKTGLEGVIAKKASSEYDPGNRTRDWLKIKINKRQEVVIGGYTRNEGSSKGFSSLLVGVFGDNKKLKYTGKIGTGFSDALQKEMLQKFKKVTTTKCPFDDEPDVNKPSRFRPNPPKASATWLKPQLVCEVSFAEMTNDGVMRHPSFEGMREDKSASEVKEEKAVHTANVLNRKSILHKKKAIVSPGKKERKTFLNPTDETQEREIGGHSLKFTNLSKLYWPKEGISKRDMLNYYYQVAPYMLPYMKDRPQSLNRHPNGINGKSFYQKDVTGKVPDWIEKFPYHSEADNEDKNFLVCTDEASLLYIASLGCIEMNPWSSRVQKPDNPDWCIIDLDPDKNPFDQVIETARVTNNILESASIPSYCKTSGSTGLHIYIPLGAKYTYEESKEFARLIVTLVHHELPGFTSIERPTANRKKKIYLDFLQNRPQATLATAYSLRPKPGATVSMPLYWEEVKPGMTIQDFTIHNAIDRLKSEGDIFKPVLGKGIDMIKVLKRLEKLK